MNHEHECSEWECPDCGRVYDDTTECPDDDCPSNERV